MTIDSISAATPRTPNTAVQADAASQPVKGREPAAAVQTADAVKAKAAVPSQQEVEEAVAKLNNSVQSKAQGLEFSIDDDSKRTIVKVIDQSTKEVLCQIPTPEALQIAKSLDTRKGLLVNQEA
jgi:flagellar protein FlaG